MKKQEQNPTTTDEVKEVKYFKVVEDEEVLLRERRKRIYGEEDAANLKETKFGIAMSGGGIRSATINLGFLKTLNCFGLVKRADYISTVSGGGYTGAYVQGTLRNYNNYRKKPSFQQFESFQDYTHFKNFKYNPKYTEEPEYKDFDKFNPFNEKIAVKYEDYAAYGEYLEYSNYQVYLNYKKDLEAYEAKKAAAEGTDKKIKLNNRDILDFPDYKEFQLFQLSEENRNNQVKKAEENTPNLMALSSHEDYKTAVEIRESADFMAFAQNKDYQNYGSYKTDFANFKTSSEYAAFKAQCEQIQTYKTLQEVEKYQEYKLEKEKEDFINFKNYQTYLTYQEYKDLNYGKIKGHIAYNELFTEEHADYMRSRGEYLFPGTGYRKIWNQFILLVSYTVSLIMSWVGPAIMAIIVGGAIYFLGQMVEYEPKGINTLYNYIQDYQCYILGGLLSLFGLHYLFNIMASYHLTISSKFSKVETVLLILAIFAFIIGYLLTTVDSVHIPEDIQKIFSLIMYGILLVILGFFTNPNATSLHRFYRDQLSKAFLNFTGTNKNVRLRQMAKMDSEEDADFLPPFPLINTCLNLQSTDDDSFNGTKTSDYFLLSPLYCGSKLTNYVKTEGNDGYAEMTLPAAVTISAAAVNPGMGIYSNKILSILTTVLNFRLGYWTWNPKKAKAKYPVVWWPFYFLYELFSTIGTDKKMLNISDGGHIENLGVYELLRRKCKLILAVDAGADPGFMFADLENLTIRARNELGIDIRFREENIPEDCIRPKPSHGYSEKRFAVADLYQIWDKVFDETGKEEIVHYKDNKFGTLVYIKSSVTAPEGRPDISPEDTLKYGTYKYKIYHPIFPHESTADQFFDPIQWEAYYQLGQHIAADVLNLDYLEHYSHQAQTLPLELLFADFDIPYPQAEEEEIPIAAPTISIDRDAPTEVDEEDELEVIERAIKDSVPAEPKTPEPVVQEEKEVFYKM